MLLCFPVRCEQGDLTALPLCSGLEQGTGDAEGASLCAEPHNDLPDTFHPSQLSSCRVCRWESRLHSHHLLGRCEVQPHVIFSLRGIWYSHASGFSSAITICCCLAHFLRCPCYAQRRQIQWFFFCEVFNLAKKSILWMYLTADSECNIKKWTH